MPCNLDASFNEIMGDGEKEYFLSAKYKDVVPETISIDELPKIMPSHRWIVFFIPSNDKHIKKFRKSLEDMDVVTWAWTSCDDLRVFAFVNKNKKIPRWLRKYPRMISAID
jgi:hypothetical protein